MSGSSAESQVKERRWRLLVTGFASGPANMAIDEAIAEAHARGLVPPTLRFYGWTPAAVSIGYFQKMAEEVDLAACRELRIDYVRRPTGGRAVLHDDELTYSVVISESLLLGDVIQTYRVLSQGLLAGMRSLGANAEMVSLEGQTAQEKLEAMSSAACFNSPSWYEVVVGGKKIVGSAQTRKEGMILQHGSILLGMDADKLFTVLKTPEKLRLRLVRAFLSKATSLNEALGRTVSWEEAWKAVADGFVEALSLDIHRGKLLPWEEQRAKELEREKYASDAWNLRK